jgi:hypothetical protein
MALLQVPLFWVRFEKNRSRISARSSASADSALQIRSHGLTESVSAATIAVETAMIKAAQERNASASLIWDVPASAFLLKPRLEA